MRRRKRKVTLTLPDEFLDLCEFDSAEPERVLRGFIADVSNIWSDRPRADGYNSNGSDQSSLALDYYLSVDHRRLYRFMREHEEVKNQLKSPGSQAADLNCRARQKDLTADIDVDILLPKGFASHPCCIFRHFTQRLFPHRHVLPLHDFATIFDA
jgi:hypothetical protein